MKNIDLNLNIAQQIALELKLRAAFEKYRRRENIKTSIFLAIIITQQIALWMF